MGVCCSQQSFSGEDFIRILIEESFLKKFTFKELEKELISLSEKQKINKNVFDSKILPDFFNHDEEELYIFYERLFEDIIITDVMNKINIYHALLAVFSHISHENPVEEFYLLMFKIWFCEADQKKTSRSKRVNNETENFYFNNDSKIETFDLKYVKKCLITYLEINLIGVTQSVYNTVLINPKTFSYDFDKTDLKILIQNICSEINIKIFATAIFKTFKDQEIGKDILKNDTTSNTQASPKTAATITINSNINNPEISKENFIKMFKNKEYLFDFTELRKKFLEFYKNNNKL